MPKSVSPQSLQSNDTFVFRHIGPSPTEVQSMLELLGIDSLSSLIAQTIPADIRSKQPLELGFYDNGRAIGEDELLASLRQISKQNRVCRSLIGMGYHECIVPSVIQRNVLENPGWYTQYTPYQSEISQGRLEALLNFQTMITEFTALPIANASLLDEATAAAEAMQMCVAAARRKRMCFFVSEDCHPQTIAVVRTRAAAISVEIDVGDVSTVDLSQGKYCGILLQYPTTYGVIEDYQDLCDAAHQARTLVVVAADLLALTILRPPGEFGADICVGSAQRFGVPLGFGGPHAAFLSAKEVFKREIPGRIVGVSRDRRGQVAYRMALQTREQHIRREKASSNICTAQVLLAIMASMYAAYHGPEGLLAIANRVHGLTEVLALGLKHLGYKLPSTPRFDTLLVDLGGVSSASLVSAAETRGYNFRVIDEHRVGLSLDERSTLEEVEVLLQIFSQDGQKSISLEELVQSVDAELPVPFGRTTPALSHPIFSKYHAEHEMLRYLHRLQAKDLSLTTSMIPLGSCTMKLNATSEMMPLSWPEFANIHPFAPSSQTEGYMAMMTGLERWLCDITGFAGVSLQPNAGSQGEFTGLLTIRAYHQSRGESERNVCLIPVSAHGTNPASAVLAGMKVVAVNCDQKGNIDVADLREKVAKHGDKVAAIMVTYPSTHGVFESSIREICEVVHQSGGQVYLDGANMNAQVGLCRPGDYGADVCHLNLHKTFCIPHGGGGPGMGPIGVAKHLEPYLPSHPVVAIGGDRATGTVSAAPFGSASILTISWMYIALMGGEGLTEATRVAILNANYMAKKLSEHYVILYAGPSGRVAHEFIVDLRPYKSSAGIEAEDVAKRLMDYGFHSPTMSFPVAGTLMIEPTESESKEELDRFCEAMVLIRQEIAAIEKGQLDRKDNPLKNAPHIAAECTGTEWNHGYSREQAAYPAPWLRDHKYWPTVARVDNVWGDRNLACICPPVSAYSDS